MLPLPTAHLAIQPVPLSTQIPPPTRMPAVQSNNIKVLTLLQHSSTHYKGSSFGLVYEASNLECLEDIQRQCVVPRPDAGVDKGGVGVDVGGDTSPPHVCHQGQSLAQLLSLAA